MNNCAKISLLYKRYNNSLPGNCIDNAKSSTYDLPTKNKQVVIGVVLTDTRDGNDRVLLCKVYSNYGLESGDLIGWSSNNFRSASEGVIKDIIQIGSIARVVL